MSSASFEEGRAEYLEQALTNLLLQEEDWAGNEEQHLDQHSEFWQAVEETLEIFAEGTIPGNLRRVAEVVTRDLQREWTTFLRRRDADENPAAAIPHKAFWSVLNGLRDEIRKSEQPISIPPEPVPVLLNEQKVNRRQICEIWDSPGLRWMNGTTALEHMVDEEIKEPGKHTKHWTDPKLARLAAAQAAQARRLEQLKARIGAKVAALTEPCTETTEELIQQGLCAKQIAQMRKITVEEVYHVADEQGWPRPPLQYSDPRTVRAPQEPEVPEEVHRSMATDARPARVKRTGEGRRRATKPAPETDDEQELPDDSNDAQDGPKDVNELEDEAIDADELADDAELADEDEAAGDGPMTLEQEIVHLHKQGLAPGVIAQNVSSDDRPVTAQKVTAIVQRYERDPQAFA